MVVVEQVRYFQWHELQRLLKHAFESSRFPTTGGSMQQPALRWVISALGMTFVVSRSLLGKRSMPIARS